MTQLLNRLAALGGIVACSVAGRHRAGARGHARGITGPNFNLTRRRTTSAPPTATASSPGATPTAPAPCNTRRRP